MTSDDDAEDADDDDDDHGDPLARGIDSVGWLPPALVTTARAESSSFSGVGDSDDEYEEEEA